MAKRMILMLGVMIAVISALGFMKFKQVETAIQVGASYQPPPEAVTSIVAQREQWPASMGVIGTMEAVHGVTVSADLPGVVEKILLNQANRCMPEMYWLFSTPSKNGPNWHRSKRRANSRA